MITTRSARLAILQATACGRETRERLGGFGGSSASTAMVLHGLDCGRVLAALERNPPQVVDWLLSAYAAAGYPGVKPAVVRCQAALYAAYTRERVVRADPGRMIRLAGAAMDDMRRRYQGQCGRGIDWYQEMVPFRRQNWAVWVGAIERMLGLLDRWDRRGLAEVAAVLPLEAA